MSSGTPQGVVSQYGIGIDIGGTGTKGGIVDLTTGQLVGERFRIPTPQPATPQAVAGVVRQIVDELQSRPEAPAPDSHVGIVFPAIIKNGVALSAANVDKSWINTDVDALMTETLGREVEALNDADGAGLAEAHYGAGRGKEGLVMVITLGTGIGSAMILNGQLVPNAELGHLEVDGHDAETRASAAAREREQLPWKKWATKRLQRYFSHVEFLFSPSLFVIGGGVSKNSEKFLPYLELRTPVEIAALRNNAGIVGAALWAQQCRDAQAAKPVIDPVD
ncbi:polyphosphate glucokinase [Kocuria rhizophila]|uniref:Polyphosphate glucokinase n=1 Tax=Kocuria rhizophila (strain ATCC 9341 / DSM 348 / NBRC 103217 / DC2201) TaxID=378753 RepID=B2GG04_KOCRD|nr:MULTISPECIES: ROK family protein [Kocuria]HAG63477.1 ROK family protein [Kocuria sp.]ASE10658.1 ROK family protein [Kocuria rhizophila]MBK4119680.1 ROK family protein [Kocuria rhizophila]MDV5998998.1 ROK family protein [Kocuria rhizophila]WTI33078.1 ROK family protein [Kocuria rhizophila]